ncbi:MAG: hypothetical protein H0T92_20280 [Pyrinomonadaceae bacterium]|nr:hypothetical protein [Pyrinomonadaceae bacterium]
MKFILLAHLAATLIMTGIIWFVQVVHYPLFSQVSRSSFITYGEAHSRLTTWVVGPPMLVEALTAVLLLLTSREREDINFGVLWIGFGLLVLIWLSTIVLQVPRHTVLGKGFDTAAHRQLVVSNWVRTAAWSARSVLVLWTAARMMR